VRRGALTLDAERMQAQWDGQVVLLSLTEFWIVHALARHPGTSATPAAHGRRQRRAR